MGFRKLFEGMTRPNPDKRITISDIKKSEFYKGPILQKADLRMRMLKIMKN